MIYFIVSFDKEIPIDSNKNNLFFINLKLLFLSFSISSNNLIDFKSKLDFTKPESNTSLLNKSLKFDKFILELSDKIL